MRRAGEPERLAVRISEPTARTCIYFRIGLCRLPGHSEGQHGQQGTFVGRVNMRMLHGKAHTRPINDHSPAFNARPGYISALPAIPAMSRAGPIAAAAPSNVVRVWPPQTCCFQSAGGERASRISSDQSSVSGRGHSTTCTPALSHLARTSSTKPSKELAAVTFTSSLPASVSVT